MSLQDVAWEAPMSGWFVTRALDQGVTLVAEPAHVNSYLVEGSERAMLVDSGLGIANIADAVRRLTSKPITVVNTHYHFDHTWGNGHFDDVRIHRSGVEALGRTVEGLKEIYLDFTQRMMQGFATLQDIDRQFFHLTAWLPMPRELPEKFDPETWGPNRAKDVTPLDDGDVVDLGDRGFTVIHTPGHSYDEICLLEEETGIMFTGDMINTGPLYTQLPESDLVDYRDSARRLCELVDDVRKVYVGHFVRYEAPTQLITDTAAAFTDLLAGKAILHDAVDILGTPVRQAFHDGFSIMATHADLEEAMTQA